MYRYNSPSQLKSRKTMYILPFSSHGCVSQGKKQLPPAGRLKPCMDISPLANRFVAEPTFQTFFGFAQKNLFSNGKIHEQ